MQPKFMEVIDVSLYISLYTYADDLQRYKFIKSKHQHRSLTQGKLYRKLNTSKVTKCNRHNCGLYKHLKEGEGFTFKCSREFKGKKLAHLVKLKRHICD